MYVVCISFYVVVQINVGKRHCPVRLGYRALYKRFVEVVVAQQSSSSPHPPAPPSFRRGRRRCSSSSSSSSTSSSINRSSCNYQICQTNLMTCLQYKTNQNIRIKSKRYSDTYKLLYTVKHSDLVSLYFTEWNSFSWKTQATVLPETESLIEVVVAFVKLARSLGRLFPPFIPRLRFSFLSFFFFFRGNQLAHANSTLQDRISPQWLSEPRRLWPSVL